MHRAFCLALWKIQDMLLPPPPRPRLDRAQSTGGDVLLDHLAVNSRNSLELILKIGGFGVRMWLCFKEL